MITTYRSSYLKLNNEMAKRVQSFCVIETELKGQKFTQVLVISSKGLVLAMKAKSVTAIKGYRSYSPLTAEQQEFGAGGLERLSTKDPSGMLEGLAKQLGFDYSVLAKAFGEGLLNLSQ
ncbi:MAG: hypothetical protein H7X94_12730 [Vallitaleaceae bacterium]|nr:hypothetical protein [Vallitaleaceae bacterium]